MAEATQPRTKSHNGQATLRQGPIAERVMRLREAARQDPQGARDEAWDWIKDLGRQAVRDRDGATSELQELFLCGQPAEGIDGQTEGILVTWTLNPIADRVLGSVTNAWMPWLGKKFFPDEKRGINTLTNSARIPSKLLWPLYSTGASPLGREAFDFKTYTEAGKLDPSVDVLVIDYESVTTNPRLLIRSIRDELVQIVPGANLGKMLVNVPRRDQPILGLYFALKSEI
jgi:hypothetical protein